MDWVIHALDDASRQCLGCGHSFLIACILDGEFSAADFEQSFSSYCDFYPQLAGRSSRDFNLAPYWLSDSESVVPRISGSAAASESEALLRLQQELGIPFAKGEPGIRASVVSAEKKTVLGLIFDHKIFDARGAELFLNGFQTWYLSGGAAGRFEIAAEPAHLNDWRNQLSAGKAANRARIAREKTSARFLPAGSGKTCLFKVRALNDRESAAVLSRSAKHAGPFMFLPYSLACAARAMDSFFISKGSSEGDFVIPVTRDMRTRLSDPLFNHLSFLFFNVPAEQLRDFDGLVSFLRIRMYDQIKEKAPEALAQASMLMRILPLYAFSKNLQGTARKPSASFSFAVLGDSAFAHDRLMDTRVENMIHVPRIPPHPGLGLFISQYRGRLNLTLSYLDTLMTSEEADRLVESVFIL